MKMSFETHVQPLLCLDCEAAGAVSEEDFPQSVGQWEGACPDCGGHDVLCMPPITWVEYHALIAAKISEQSQWN